MHVNKLKEIFEVLKKTHVHRLELSSEDLHVKLTRVNSEPIRDEDENSLDSGKKEVTNKPKERETKGMPKTSVVSANPTSSKELPASFDVNSPEIGEFSRFNPVNKKQYVKLRDTVKPGSIIGVVVSMHIANEVRADREGKIVEFLVEEKQPVEYGQPLMRCLPTD